MFMAAARHGEPAPPVADGRSEGLAELMLEVAQCFFRSLARLGPLTVPQIAQMRPTSRQRMQRLADELAAEGLVEFIENPKHRRSKLVRLTPEGVSRYRALEVQLLGIASTLAVGLGEEDIRQATESVRCLS